MEFVDTIGPTLMSLLIKLPVCLVWLAGIVVALVFWRRQPRVSLLTLIAIIILAFISLVGTYFSISIPFLLDRQGMDIGQLGMIIVTFNIAIAVITAVAWALLLAAIFGWRRSQTTESKPAADDESV